MLVDRMWFLLAIGSWRTEDWLLSLATVEEDGKEAEAGEEGGGVCRLEVGSRWICCCAAVC